MARLLFCPVLTVLFIAGCASGPDSLMLISSIPPGAEVSVNGQELGKTPCDFRYLADDSINGYVFEATKPGHRRVVKICGGEDGLAVPAQMFFDLPPEEDPDAGSAGVVIDPPPEITETPRGNDSPPKKTAANKAPAVKGKNAPAVKRETPVKKPLPLDKTEARNTTP